MRRNLSARTEITLCIVIMFNRSHVKIGRATTSQSLLLLLAGLTYIMVLFFAHIPFVVNRTINATPPERLQQHLVCHCFSVRLSPSRLPFSFFSFFKTFQSSRLGVKFRVSVRLGLQLGLRLGLGLGFIFYVYFISAKPVAAGILAAKYALPSI